MFLIFCHKVYVATEQPTILLGQTLNSGEINLSWTTLPVDVQVTGYRVVCSTSSEFPPPTSDVIVCNKTTTSSEILLSGLDVTRPLYAAVQVIRQINGITVTDPVYSPVSDIFCPGM